MPFAAFQSSYPSWPMIKAKADRCVGRSKLTCLCLMITVSVCTDLFEALQDLLRIGPAIVFAQMLFEGANDVFGAKSVKRCVAQSFECYRTRDRAAFDGGSV